MAKPDKYDGGKDALLALGDDWVALASFLSDANPLPDMYRYIVNIATTDGTVRCRSRGGVSSDFPLKSGAILQVRPVGISTTGTTNVTLVGVL